MDISKTRASKNIFLDKIEDAYLDQIDNGIAKLCGAIRRWNGIDRWKIELKGKIENQDENRNGKMAGNSRWK